MLNNNYGNRVLICFDAIVDIDLGLLRLIKESYNNEKFMDKRVLNNKDDFFKVLLIMNKSTNPIVPVLRDDKKDQADAIYKTFIEEKYNEVLEKSTPTEIYNIALAYMDAGDGVIQVKVLCKNETEQQYINLKNNKIDTVVGDLDTIDLSTYDSIFVKNIRDLLKVENLGGKNLYISSYFNNFEDDNKTVLVEAAMMLGDANIIYTIDPYRITLPVG